jgi:hypothetical protein
MVAAATVLPRAAMTTAAMRAKKSVDQPADVWICVMVLENPPK